MLFIGKSFGLVSETGGFLVNPGPEPSEPAVVEASDDFNKEKCCFGQRNKKLYNKPWSGRRLPNRPCDALPILPSICAPSATRRAASTIVLPIPKTDVSDLT